MRNTKPKSPSIIAAMTAAALLPVWFAILVFAANAGAGDAPSEGTPFILAILLAFAVPFGLFCGAVGCPVLGRLLNVDRNRYAAFFAIVLAVAFVSALIASSLVGLDRLGLATAWQIVPYLATMLFGPPFAVAFVGYCISHLAFTRVENGGEPCDATESGLQGFTNGKSNVPTR